MSNGGQVANRGFIFQAIVAEIQCLERNDWDSIKVEPETKNDKVDIQLYQNGDILSAIQVKSSINDFQRADAKEWLELARKDAPCAKEIHVYLVGDSYSVSCRQYIQNEPAITTFPFDYLPDICMKKLVDYIRDSGIGGEVRVDDLEFIDDALFAKLFKNSIAKEPISRAAFEERFQKALPVHVIPKCLTPIPAVNYAVGLVGRDDVKKTVRGMLEENHHTVLVNGLGGIGKTAVMQHVCNDLRNEGKYVAWIECGGSLEEDLLLLRTALGIPKSYSADDAYEKILDEIKSNVRLKENLYLFMDNLSRQLSEDEQGILTGLKVYVMATSRFEHEGFQNLPLDVLAEQSALDMFYGYYLEKQKDKTRRCEEAARDIIESVQSHTMLVELLAKAAWKKGGTLDAFRDELKKKVVFEVFKRNLNTKHDKNRTIEECVMKLYEISDLSPEQQHIMRLFTIFTPEKEIYYEIGDWADLDMAAMDELVDLGWLERGGLESGYQIHQIVKDSIARQMEKNGEEVKLDEYGDFLDKVIDTDDYLGREVTYDKVRERVVLTEDVARFIADSGREDADTGELFNNMAGVYYAQGDYEKVLEYLGKALAIRERVLGTGHPDTATTYNNMAVVYHAQGDYEKALKYNGKALAIRERVLGKDHPDTATTYNNMAAVYEDQSYYEKALEYYGKALTIVERVLGRDHPSTATTYNNMAAVFRAQGEYEKALEYYGKAMAIRERVLGRDHPSTSTTYSNMALVYYAQGDYVKALEYYGKALATRERVLGRDHPSTATIYSNMALVYADQGDYEKALEYNGRVLTIRERELGTGHPDTATTYNNMAMLYANQGDYDKALEYYGKALFIVEKVLGPNHPYTASTYNNMAGAYRAQGDYVKALEYYGKALAIRERVLGPDHPKTAAMYNNLAGVYEKQGFYVKALEYYGKALAVCERVLGPDHPSTATTYNNLAGVYREQGDYIKALEHYKRAYGIFLTKFGENHPHTKIVLSNIEFMESKTK